MSFQRGVFMTAFIIHDTRVQRGSCEGVAGAMNPVMASYPCLGTCTGFLDTPSMGLLCSYVSYREWHWCCLPRPFLLGCVCRQQSGGVRCCSHISLLSVKWWVLQILSCDADPLHVRVAPIWVPQHPSLWRREALAQAWRSGFLLGCELQSPVSLTPESHVFCQLSWNNTRLIYYLVIGQYWIKIRGRQVEYVSSSLCSDAYWEPRQNWGKLT